MPITVMNESLNNEWRRSKLSWETRETKLKLHIMDARASANV